VLKSRVFNQSETLYFVAGDLIAKGRKGGGCFLKAYTVTIEEKYCKDYILQATLFKFQPFFTRPELSVEKLCNTADRTF
jgi:hypothetical protein